MNATATDRYQIAPRMERLPLSPWHHKLRFVVGSVNHLRALGSGASSVLQRLSSVLSPYLVGIILPHYGVGGVYGMFAAFAIIGGITCAILLAPFSPKKPPVRRSNNYRRPRPPCARPEPFLYPLQRRAQT